VNQACPLFVVPSWSSNPPLYPSKGCELGSVLLLLLICCFLLGLTFEPFKELRVRHESRMFRREVAAWHQMTIHYGLTDAWNLDSFRKMSRKYFTFDNRRAGLRSFVSRLDKFMVS